MAIKSELSFRTKFLFSLGSLALLTSCIAEPQQATWVADYCEGGPCQPNSTALSKTGDFSVTEDRGCPKEIKEEAVSFTVGNIKTTLYRYWFLKNGTCRVTWPTPRPSPSPTRPTQ